MRFSGFAGYDAPRAVFRQLPADFAALVVDNESGMHFWFCWFDAPRAMLPRLPAVFSMLQLLELHLEICTFFLRVSWVFQLDLSSNFCAS